MKSPQSPPPQLLSLTVLVHLRIPPLLKLPAGALTILREAARLVLRRPVVGVAVAARVPDGRWLLIRRADTGEWALPGGTLEWGETIRELIPRELREESGANVRSIGSLVGVFSRPDRDVRFHGVTIVVACDVDEPTAPPVNPLEITEVGLFADDELPPEMGMGTGDMLQAARAHGPPVIE
ncbi:MAG TPA: NUDIX hydrolase [Polyangiaceae bacterium]|nr:NUDIX hydrolase [Polyangiaceae bacterium]